LSFEHYLNVQKTKAQRAGPLLLPRDLRDDWLAHITDMLLVAM